MSPLPPPASLLGPARLQRFGLAVAAAMVVAFVIVVATATGVDAIAGGRVGGDFAAFRTAGVLLLDTPGALLDPVAQHQEMAAYLDGRFAPFPYPPLFGYLYVPFALLPFRVGYVAYVIVLVMVAAVAIRWTMDLLGVATRWRVVGLLGGLTYAGTFLSISAAQNTVLTLAILAGSLRLVAAARPELAGLVLTLLWFKPQYAIPVLGLVLVAGRVRTVAVALAGGLVIVAITTAVFGPGWPAAWYDLLALTDAGNRVFNTGNTVSSVEWLRGIVAAPWGDVLGLSAALVLGAASIVAVHRHRDPGALLALVGVAILATAPHALRYELALLVPALALVTRHLGIRGGVVAWAMAVPLVFGVPAPLRIAYVLAVGVVTWQALEAAAPMPRQPVADAAPARLDDGARSA